MVVNNSALFLCLVVFATTQAVSSEIVTPLYPFQAFHRRPPPPTRPSSERAAEERYFTQKLDHFDVLDDRTWQQRFFISNQSFIPGGPVLFYLSGEWTAYPEAVTESFVSELAAEHGGFLINLEHRYYGLSHPTLDTTTPNLLYLNADQALEDAALFTQSMMADMSEYDLTGPWVVIGASYSAQLSAWARARFPHLYIAAISSSAPVFAQLDAPEYFEVVGEALNVTHPKCPEVISDAMEELQVFVDEQNAANITELFNLCAEIDLSVPESMMAVYLYTALFYAYQVQYAKDGNLESICGILRAGQARPLETVALMIRTAYAPRCLVTNPDVILNYYANETQWGGSALHEFYYQLCLEYGHYMSLSSPNQPFGQVLPVEYYLMWCPNVYGPEFTRERNEAGIARTNLLYGGWTPDVTHVIYTHGSLDPWHKYGILQDLGPDTPAIVIEGESHCRDLQMPEDSDSQPLKNARLQISQILSNWLQNPKL